MPFATPSLSVQNLDLAPHESFQQAAQSVLDFLNVHFKMGLWMVTRTHERSDQWIVLKAIGEEAARADLTNLTWSESYCSRMVAGQGPRVAPDSAAIPAYAAAPINAKMKIGSYVGIPLRFPDGSLLGTLCGVSREKLGTAIVQEEPLFDLLGQLLSKITALEIEMDRVRRQAQAAEALAYGDSLTGLLNRRGFEAMLAGEEERCRRYGHGAGVIALDLNGLKQINDVQGHHVGDELIKKAGDTIRKTLRASDMAARVGGDEFMIIAVESDGEAVHGLERRLRSAFEKAGLSIAMGTATRYTMLADTCRDADASMYANKREQKERRRSLLDSECRTEI